MTSSGKPNSNFHPQEFMYDVVVRKVENIHVVSEIIIIAVKFGRKLVLV